MHVEPMSIEGAWTFTPRQFPDDRGVFLEWFRAEALAAAAGHDLRLAQANCSVSAAGVVRGVHYADVPPSQAKYVTCLHGAVLDVVVDLRVNSPTFGRHESVLLDDTDRRAVYVSEGLGHAFMSLQDGSTVVYACSEPYSPAREHGVHPLDPRLAIEWPSRARDGSPITAALSPKDAEAPSLEEALDAGALPAVDATRAFREATASR